MQKLVTFDFHNTLATCDPWFELEIRDLPADVLTRIDPTLVPDRDEITSRYRRLREEVMRTGREVDAVNGVRRVADELGIDVSTSDIAARVDEVMREMLRHAAPVPGAVEAVRAITTAGVPVGVVSSAVYHPFLEWTLEAFGISDDLAFVMTSASCGHYKSTPAIYHHAMRMVGADPAGSIHIGDSPQWDVGAAQQAGMTTIWFDNGYTGTYVDRSHDVEPDHVVTSLSEVAPWVLDRLGATAQ